MAASVKQPIRIVVFSTAMFVALFFAEQEAQADDTAPVASPSPDPGGGTPPLDSGTSTPPALPPVVDPSPPPADPPPPVVVPPIVPGGTVDLPSDLPDPAGPPAVDDPSVPGFPAIPAGETTNQITHVTTGGTATANTGGNTSNATGTAKGGSESAQPGGAVLPPPFSGTTGAGSKVTTGNAHGRGSVDENGIHQVVNAAVSENGKVTVVQVAIIVNVGIGIAGSGGNFAVEAAVVTPTASVAMVISQGETATGGSGPTPAHIDTGNAHATGNSGTTKVVQSIQLTGGDVANQLASVLNIGVGVANSGLNFALASVSTNNGGGPASATFVTLGGTSITAGPANALGNRSASTVFQIVTVTASGNGSLLVVQRAIIVNFGLALANSGLNAAGGGALNAAWSDTANAQQLLLMLLDQGGSGGPVMIGGSGGPGQIGTGRAGAIGNDTKTGILQRVEGSVTGDEVARAVQDAWVGNFGIGVANSGGNGAEGLSGLDASSVGAARDALGAFLAGLTGVGDPVQGLDASFRLGSNLLQLQGNISGTETLLGVVEPGTEPDADNAAVTIRQVTAVLNIGIAFGDSGHNVAASTSHGTGSVTTVAGTDTTASASITTGDARAVGSDFAATVCQAIGDALACAEAPPAEPPVEPPEEPEVPVVPEVVVPSPPLQAAPPPPTFSTPTPRPATLPFTGSPIGAELAAGSTLLIAGMLMARRRRTGAHR